MFVSTETIEEEDKVSEHRPTMHEIKSLQEALNMDFTKTSIRLREGEHQFALAKAIAEFQLEPAFPDVKDIIRKISGEKSMEDIQLIRKIQTILKKMEKSNIVRILPKKKPWELQRYMLISFKFQDAESNMVVFATDQETKQSHELLQSALHELGTSSNTRNLNIARVLGLSSSLFASYFLVVWSLIQPITSPLVFVPALSVAVICSIALGKNLAK